jgi:hypothetical protein
MPNDQAKGFLNNIIASATWDGVKRGIGCSLVTGLATALWEKLKHGSLDWVAIGGMFALTMFVVMSIFRKREPTIATVDGILEGLPKQPEVNPQYWKPKWQRLQWANAERERLESEVRRWKALYESNTAPEITEEMRQSIALQNRLIELGRSIDGFLSPLQIEAIQLSTQLLDFLKQLGPPLAPKYTAQQFYNIPPAQMQALMDANDGDFLEACEYYRKDGNPFSPAQLENQPIAHMTRLFPWYQRVSSSYALNFKGKVDIMRHRFAVEGLPDNIFLLPIEGKKGEKNIRSIAAKLWELAYKISEKERTNEDTRIQGRPKRIEEL